MIASRHYFALTLVTLVLAFSIEAQVSKDMSGDETAVRPIVQRLQEGWNAHDGKAFAAPFSSAEGAVAVGCGSTELHQVV